MALSEVRYIYEVVFESFTSKFFTPWWTRPGQEHKIQCLAPLRETIRHLLADSILNRPKLAQEYTTKPGGAHMLVN